MNKLPGIIRQNGYVVSDIEMAMGYWTESMGVGPFYYIESVPLDWFRYQGIASDIELSIAMANTGDLQIELIQQRNTAPSMYLDFLKEVGEGLQHHAWWSTNYQKDFDAALASGFKIGQEGQINEGRFVYFTTPAHPGTIIELSDISGPKGQFFEHIKNAADKWDGARPIRRIE